MKDLAMIACVSADRGLGRNGELLWHLKPDMQFFRRTTTGYPVIMGGKTYRSIGRPLPNRTNIVLTRQSEIPGTTVFHDKLELNHYLEEAKGPKFIIGGASLYSDHLEQSEVLYLTEVKATKPADTFFPEFDRQDFSREVLEDGEIDGVRFEIVKYQRQDRR